MRLSKSGINYQLVKYDIGMCFVCNRIREKKELKYIHRFISPWWIPACENCRKKYKENKILKYFVKEEEA